MTNSIGFMQGRLSSLVDGKIQAFPWDNWEAEFELAQYAGFDLMEWTIDQEGLYENPLMTIAGRDRIRKLSSQFGIKINSVTADCFMQAPFWKDHNKNVQNQLQVDFRKVCMACSELKLEKIVVPLVDNGSLTSLSEENSLLEFMRSHEPFFCENNVKIVFESDFGSTDLKRFISHLPSKQFGINYDSGNSAASGFNAIDEFDAYGKRVLNVHIKDRVHQGATVPLGSGDADFELVFKLLSKLPYHGDFILQTARANDGAHMEALQIYKRMVDGWIIRSRNYLEQNRG